METFSVVVIGAGPGGYSAALRAAQLGASVTIVEKEELGGACLNWACIPTKTLIAWSRLYAERKAAESFGIKGPVSLDYAAMIDRKDQAVVKLREGVSHLLKANGVQIVKGTASFQNRSRIRIQAHDGSSTLIGAEKTILAAGCAYSIPDFLPRSERVLEPRTFLQLRSLPSSALVLGGGIIGCEFACLLAQLDVKVTIVEMDEDILPELDVDIRREVRRRMEKASGIRILTGRPLESIAAADRSVRGIVAGEPVEAEVLLVAVGRRPVSACLGLENAGLSTDDEGYLSVDEFSRTQVATIYAVGDITGGPKFAHAATSQGLVAAERACGRRGRKNEQHIPLCIFTTPEIATVGLSEQEAQRQGREIKTGKFPFAALGKALALGDQVGFVKWIADPATDQLLGAQIVGPHATELIGEAAAAVRAELTAAELAHTIHAHPTFSEAWMEAANVVLDQPIHLPPRKRRVVSAEGVW
jgi:dihydrolipoamide dehydrogenase